MTLRMLRPGLGNLRSPLKYIEHRAPEQVVARLTGGSLKAIRKRVYARSGQLCECPDCRSGYPLSLTWTTFECDHIVPLYQGGTNAFSNFRALHKACHARITAQQQAERNLQGYVYVDDSLPCPVDLSPVRRRPDDDECLC
jgi:hypothetical protein